MMLAMLQPWLKRRRRASWVLVAIFAALLAPIAPCTADDDAFIMQESLISYLKIGDGECHTYGQGRTRGLGALDISHDRCREVCEHEHCIGYTYEPCAQSCIVHGDPAALPSMDGWRQMNGGARIEFGSAVCGSACFRRMGPCPNGTVVSSGIPVDHAAMAYGTVRVVACPEPYASEVTIECTLDGAIIRQGRCRIPCPPGTMLSGAFLVDYPEIRHGETVVAMCPQDPPSQGNLSINCFDGTAAHVGGLCGYDCAPGSARIGSATMLYPEMEHQARLTLPCPSTPFPGWVGEIVFECINSFVTAIEGTCHKHCAAGDMPVVIGQGQGNISGIVPYGNLSHGENTTGYCSSTPVADQIAGFVDMSCVDGTVHVLSQANCNRHCLAGSIGEGVKALDHSDLIHGDIEILFCADGFTGNLTVNCTDGTAMVEEGECMMACQEGPTVEHRSVSITSNGVTLLHPPTEHGETIQMTCPESHFGTLDVYCNDGEMEITDGFCGLTCAAGSYYINGATLHYPNVTHGSNMTVACQYPYVGNTTVRCYDGEIRYSGFCGILCPPGSRSLGGASIPYTEINHTQVLYFGCVTDFPDAGLTYSGSLALDCNDGVVGVQGICYPDCNAGVKKSNGYEIFFTKLLLDESGNFTCEPTPEYGSVILTCSYGETLITGGSCGVPCNSGTFSSQETLHTDVYHPVIPHDSNMWVDCPIQLSGSVEIRCYNSDRWVIAGGCGDRCPSSTQVVYGASFTTPVLEHLQNYSQQCLPPYGGTVFVECAFGALTVTSHCRQGCFGGDFEFPSRGEVVPGAVVAYPDFGSGEQVELNCPGGYAGDPVLECGDGEPFVAESGCFGHCPAGNYYGAGYTISHYEILHGETQIRGCPDFWSGSLLLNCTSGEVVLQEGGCFRNCFSGSAFVREGVTLPHPDMVHEEELPPVACPEGYIGHIRFECDSGVVYVSEGYCYKHCEADTLQGASFGALLHEQVADVPCPELGLIEVSCNDGVLAVLSGKCIYSCDPGEIPDENGIMVAHGDIQHLGNISGTCQGALGTRSVFCNDTVVTLLSLPGELCYRHCEAQAIATQDGTMIVSPFTEHGRSSYVQCPDGKLGVIEVRCDNAVATPFGVCGATNCAAGTMPSGRALVSFPPINDAHRDGPEACANDNPGFLGEVTFLCTNGTTSIEEVMAVYENNLTGRPNLTEVNRSQRIRLCGCCLPPPPTDGAEPVAGQDLSQIIGWFILTGSFGLVSAIVAGSWPFVRDWYKRRKNRVSPEDEELPYKNAEVNDNPFDSLPRNPKGKFRQAWEGDWQRW